MTIKGKLVLIEWIDSTARQGWHGEAKLDVAIIHTVGWIAHEDGSQVTVAPNVASTGQLGQQTAIPKSCIRRRQTLFPRKGRSA